METLVQKLTDITLTCQKLNIQNINLIAKGIIKDKDSKTHDITFVISDNNLITVFDSTDRANYLYQIVYDSSNDPNKLKITTSSKKETIGYIIFETKSIDLSVDWKITLTNDDGKDITLTDENGTKSLTLKNDTKATVQVSKNDIIN